MQDEVRFHFSTFWPHFQTLFQGDFGSSEGISALVIAILLVIFAGFLLMNVARAGWQARQAVAFFRELLDDVSPDTLPDKRQELAERVANLPASQGRLRELWHEFDASLSLSADTRQLHNAYDAAYFFNSQSLARGITESRLLAAVPGFLTAIGVIGTFAGLFLGLAGIDLKNLDSALLGINRLVEGAAIAFKTSVWGVSLSVAFNVIEKSVEQRIRQHIAALQDRIDALFPRLNPEQTLAQVHQEMYQAATALEQLPEQIGGEMQGAILQATKRFESSILKGMQQVMAPAVEALVQAAQDLAERQGRESTEALERLIRQFSETLTGRGDEQRTMMQNAANAVTQAIDQWRASMTEFLARLEAQHSFMDGRDTVRTQAIDQHLKASQEILAQGQNLHERLGLLAHSLQVSATELKTGSEHLQQSTGGLKLLSEGLHTGVNRLDRTLKQVFGQTRSLSEENITTGRQLSEILKVFTELQETLSASARAVVDATTASRDQTIHLVRHQQQLFNALDTHIKRLQQQMAGLMNEYAEQVQEQTHERLNQWNLQTQQFAEAMESAVQAIASVVEEIEDKLGR